MATLNLQTFIIGSFCYQSGNGTPDHDSLVHTIYIDLDSGIHYANTDGASAWSKRNSFTDAEKTKIGHLTVSQAVDLDTMESDIVTNTAKVTNATHTGDVEGATALTIAADAVTYAKMQNVVADNVFLGNISGTGSIVAELTAAEVRTLLGVAPKMVAIAKAINYTAVDRDFVLVTTGASDKTITLPAVASSTDVVIEVKKVDSGVGDVIVDGDGAETIDGAATKVLNGQYTSLTLHCDGSTWHIK